jgi:hypothetical protein
MGSTKPKNQEFPSEVRPAGVDGFLTSTRIALSGEIACPTDLSRKQLEGIFNGVIGPASARKDVTNIRKHGSHGLFSRVIFRKPLWPVYIFLSSPKRSSCFIRVEPET